MNNLLDLWEADKAVINAWLSIPNSFTAEAFGKMGWDSVTIDLQHGQRVRDAIVTREISIGDYVLSGGELPAAVLCDSIVRLIPGVLNDETSALTDSFQDNLLAPPVYTRPANYNGMKVPEILLSGNQKKIEEWREEKSLIKTKSIRPDLID